MSTTEVDRSPTSGVLGGGQRLIAPRASIDRMSETWPTARLIHTPVHASSLNQCEIYFSVVQHNVITANDFYDPADLENRLMAFQPRTTKPQ